MHIQSEAARPRHRRKSRLRPWVVAALASFSFGCSGTERVGTVSSAELWQITDSPDNLTAYIRYDIDALPLDGRTPAPLAAGWFWPASRDSINDRWAPGELSPAEKYELAFGRLGAAATVRNSLGFGRYTQRCKGPADCPGEICANRRPGAPGVCVPGWHGLCNGWAAYMVREGSPKTAINFNGVKFDPLDVDALMSLLYFDISVRLIGTRCEAINAEEIRTRRECRDLNPGSLHVAMANLIGIAHRPFVVETDANAVVWNRPAYSYRVANAVDGHLMEIDLADALALLGRDTDFRTLGIGARAMKGALTLPGNGSYVLRARNTHGGALSATVAGINIGSTTGTGTEQLLVRIPAAGGTLTWTVTGNPIDRADLMVEISAGTTPTAPVVYPLNPAAKRLFYVASELTVAGSIDPAATIDRGRATTYQLQYLLEVDGSNQIIGGEWTGGSQTSHPDFAWLPGAPAPEYLGVRYRDVQRLFFHGEEQRVKTSPLFGDPRTPPMAPLPLLGLGG